MATNQCKRTKRLQPQTELIQPLIDCSLVDRVCVAALLQYHPLREPPLHQGQGSLPTDCVPVDPPEAFRTGASSPSSVAQIVLSYLKGHRHNRLSLTHGGFRRIGIPNCGGATSCEMHVARHSSWYQLLQECCDGSPVRYTHTL